MSPSELKYIEDKPMELNLFLRVLLRRWYCLILPVLVVGVGVAPDLLARPGAGGGYSASIRYTAAQVLDAIPNRDGDYQDVWLASELTVNAFTDWVLGSRFQDAIREKLAGQGIDIAPGTFSVSAENEKSVGRITLTSDDEAGLTAITAAAVEILQSTSSEIFPQLGGVAAQVELLDAPTLSAIPAPIASRLTPVIKLVLAAIVGVVLALALDYADPYLRRRAQLESSGVTVLSAVPRE